MTWPEFREFLWNFFVKFKVFANNISKKVKCKSQYQDKSLQD